jgi:hypothetical protein
MGNFNRRATRAAAAFAGAAALVVASGTVAFAGASAQPAATALGNCGDGDIIVWATGTGLPARTAVSITKDAWFWIDANGQKTDEEMETTTHTVAANGTVEASHFWTEDLTGMASTQATIRDASGNVLAVSPIYSYMCPLW